MKAKLVVENIKKYIPVLAKVVPSQSPVPVLLNVLLEATEDGLFLSATDLEMAVRIKIPAKVEEQGSVTVSGRHFVEIINSLSSSRLSFTLSGEGLQLESDEGKIVLQTIPSEEFPSLFDQKGEKLYTFSSQEIEDIFSKLLFAVSQEDSRPELTGVYMVQKDSYIDCVSTDGYRLSLRHIKSKRILEEESGIILSAKLIGEVMHLKDDKIDMYVYEEGNQVIFETAEITLIGRLINGSFPNYERVIPESTSTKATVDKDEFAKAVKLSSVFARESANIIRLKVSDKNLTVFSRSSGVGEGEVHVAVVQEGEDNEIAFNVKFLNDVLRNIDDKEVTVELNSATEPAVFRSPKDKDFLHVIMPVRVQE